MSTEKKGLFSRLKNVISSTVNDAVDAVSDPGQELALMLDDLAAQIKKAEKDHKQALVDRKVMERKVDEQKKNEADWAARAEQAVKLGDEKLARAALEHKSNATRERQDAENALTEQINLVEGMAQDIKDSKARLKSLNLRRGSLMAQARAAKKGETSAAGVGIAASSQLDDIEAKITQIEVMNEVMEEGREERVEAAQIERKLAELSGESELDAELEALKARVRGERALTAGDASED